MNDKESNKSDNESTSDTSLPDVGDFDGGDFTVPVSDIPTPNTPLPYTPASDTCAPTTGASNIGASNIGASNIGASNVPVTNVPVFSNADSTDISGNGLDCKYLSDFYRQSEQMWAERNKYFKDMVNYTAYFNAYQQSLFFLNRDEKIRNLKKELSKERKKYFKIVKDLIFLKLEVSNLRNKLQLPDKDADLVSDDVPSLYQPSVDDDYTFLDEDELDSRLKDVFGKLTNIRDIMDIRGTDCLPDLMQNEKFRKLYHLIPSISKLDGLVGMGTVKESVFDHICYYVQSLSSSDEIMHIAITGSPGVGKTELGRILGDIYLNLGFLQNNKFIIAKRSDLVGQYLGHTAKKTQEMINKAEGGVLFIDEAYALGNEEKRDSFAKECIDTINQNLTEKKGKFLCIIAGYKDSLDQCFFAYNEGLRRRFPFVYHIEDYSAEELREIFMILLRRSNWLLENDNIANIKFFKENRGLFPFYGGDMEVFVQKCKFAYSRRMMRESKDIQKDKKITQVDLENALKSFKHMRGYDKKNERDEVWRNMYT